MEDVRELMTEAGVADGCFEHPRNGAVFLKPDLEGTARIDWLHRNGYQACTALGAQQLSVVKN